MTLDERLAALAEHIDAELAATSAPNPQSPAAPTTTGLDGRTRTTSRRGVLTAAAATVLAVGIGGVYALVDRDPGAVGSADPTAPATTTTPPTTPPDAARAEDPARPTAFPVLDPERPGAVGSYSLATSEATRVTALIGIVSTTELTGGVQVEAVAQSRADARRSFDPSGSPSTPVDAHVTTTSTDGEPAAVGTASGPGAVSIASGPAAPAVDTIPLYGGEADVYREPGQPELVTVIVDSEVEGVSLRFTGIDPLALLRAHPPFVHVRPADPSNEPDHGRFTLAFDEPLPGGYQVIVEPRAIPDRTIIAALSIDHVAGQEGNLIEVSIEDPLVALAAAGPMTAVSVGEAAAWLAVGRGFGITWPVDATTYVAIGGSATAEEAQAVAATVTFTSDEAAWRQRYGVPAPDFGTLVDPAGATTTTTSTTP